MSECVGIAYIGVAVIIWSIATFLMFLAVGKVTLYITRTATAIVVSAIHIAVCLFLIFWSREPNFIMIVLISFLLGVIIAFWAVGPISELTYSMLKIVHMYIRILCIKLHDCEYIV